MASSKRTVVVLDRDGVINQDSADYIKSPDEWHAMPGSIDAIAKLRKAGFEIAVATNQSGVARGLFSVDTLRAIHQKMLAQIQAAGGCVQRIFFCLHGPDDQCNCRKPKPGLLLQAAEYFACGFDNMIVIGDSERDLLAADAVKARSILVRTGNGRKTERKLRAQHSAENLEVYEDLAAAADALIAERDN